MTDRGFSFTRQRSRVRVPHRPLEIMALTRASVRFASRRGGRGWRGNGAIRTVTSAVQSHVRTRRVRIPTGTRAEARARRAFREPSWISVTGSVRAVTSKASIVGSVFDHGGLVGDLELSEHPVVAGYVAEQDVVAGS